MRVITHRPAARTDDTGAAAVMVNLLSDGATHAELLANSWAHQPTCICHWYGKRSAEAAAEDGAPDRVGTFLEDARSRRQAEKAAIT